MAMTWGLMFGFTTLVLPKGWKSNDESASRTNKIGWLPIMFYPVCDIYRFCLRSTVKKICPEIPDSVQLVYLG
jgi:hypothetical protein